MSGTLGRIKRELTKGWRKLLPSSVRPAEWPQDFDEAAIQLYRAVGPYTMTTRERVVTLGRAVDYIVSSGIPGDVVECGVAAGGSSMAIALSLLARGDVSREIWLYDTYEGMPEPGPHDVGRHGTSAIHKYKRKMKSGVSTWHNISVETVRENMARTGYPAEKLKFIKGKVEETLPQTAPGAISLLRCDTDWYESQKMELEVLWPRLAVGGIVLFDDYYRWLGSRKAADEYFAKNGIRIFLSRIDANAVIGVKQ